MDDLISKNQLYTIINNWPESVIYKDWVQSAIANASIIDPVSHGMWISYLDGDYIMPEQYYQCSVCKDRGYSYKSNYCPNCGAKMDK